MIGTNNYVNYPFGPIWGWWGNFFPWWWWHAYPFSAVGKKRNKLIFKKYFKKIAWPFFKTLCVIYFLIHSNVFDILCQAKHMCIVVYPPNNLLKIDFKCFFHCVAHLVGPPPSLSPWLVTLHLWSTFGPYGDPPYLLHPWWGKGDFPWCCVGYLCMYHKRCMISRFM
jgi:hypothetical protein